MALAPQMREAQCSCIGCIGLRPALVIMRKSSAGPQKCGTLGYGLFGLCINTSMTINLCLAATRSDERVHFVLNVVLFSSDWCTVLSRLFKLY